LLPLHLCGEELIIMKFLVDRMLGKLAKALRLLGYDAIYYQGEDLTQLIRLAREQDRVILTRNTKLSARKPEDRVVRITNDPPKLQLRELQEKGHIVFNEKESFSRCLICNVLLDGITRKEVEGKVPDFIFHNYQEFYRCSQCGRIYWPGTHQQNMQKRIKEILTP
jgi:uncharacterized protein with PIN domain